MKRKGKIWFFVVFILIFVLTYTTIMGVTTRYGDTITPVIRGVQDIRFGIDIRGGVDVTFVPADGVTATAAQMDGAQQVMENRLVSLGITDYEVYKDTGKSRLILRFPWQVGETEFNPETAIQELSATAHLTFRMGDGVDEAGNPTGEVILTGSDIASATASYGIAGSSGTAEHYVSLSLNDAGSQKFATATAQAAASGGTISIWMDNEMISNPNVNEAITGGTASISGNFDAKSAKALADKINGGALPFAMQADSYSTISPTLGSQSLQAMVIAGLIALVVVAIFMLISYKLVGFVALISLIGQIAATLALVSRYFVVFPSFTLTLPGIAGIILAIGMGVDANVITGERIKEELRSGKKLDNALSTAFHRGFAPIVDGNITVLIVAAILMGAFGPSDGFFAYVFKPIFFMFGASTAGSIYSFGYTLMVGVILNFVFGVFCTRVMLRSLSKMKMFRKPSLYGGLAKGKEAKPTKYFNFINNRKKYFAISGAVIALIVIFSFVFGVGMDVQFSGGAIVTYSYSGEVDANVVQSTANEVLGGQVSVQKGENASAGQTLTISLAGNRTLDVQTLEKLSDALEEKFPGSNLTQLEVNNVAPSIGKEFLLKSVVAVLAAFILILIYIAIRFRRIGGWRGGVTAVVALLHDLIIVYGTFVFLRVPLNSNFIAALLTILGYSINNTVVIYDRVRENRSLYGRKLSFADNVNLSINQSLPRSIKTSLTTLFALVSVCVVSLVFGLQSLFTFVFPLAVGMVAGTFSSICIAGPLWTMWEYKKNPPAKKGGKAVLEVTSKGLGGQQKAIAKGDEASSKKKGKNKEEDDDAKDEVKAEKSVSSKEKDSKTTKASGKKDEDKEELEEEEQEEEIEEEDDVEEEEIEEADEEDAEEVEDEAADEEDDSDDETDDEEADDEDDDEADGDDEDEKKKK